MKKVYVLAIMLFAMLNLKAQVPQAIPYQAVARDNSDNLIANQNISLRFSIHDVTSGGTIVYQETQSATTNALGLFSVNIGQGTPVLGTFSNISWGNGAKFNQVEFDPTGGNNFTDMGTQQLMSVPYAYMLHIVMTLAQQGLREQQVQMGLMEIMVQQAQQVLMALTEQME